VLFFTRLGFEEFGRNYFLALIYYYPSFGRGGGFKSGAGTIGT